MAQLNRRHRDELRFGANRRLADRLVQPETQWMPPATLVATANRKTPQEADKIRVTWEATAAELRDDIKKSKKIDANNVGEFFFGSTKDMWEWKTLPCVAPICDSYFVEMQRPKSYSTPHKFIGDPAGAGLTSWGVLFSVESFDATMKWCETALHYNPVMWNDPGVPLVEACRWVLRTVLITERDGYIIGPMEIGAAFLGHSGEMLLSPFGTVPGLNGLDMDDDMSMQLKFFLHELMYPCFLAISFFHCKNLSPVDVQPDRAYNRERRKVGRPPLMRYTTIDINPMHRILRSEGRMESDGLQRALHTCRNHFRTYTADAPLFGKHVGTFWVPQHARGSADAGIVKSKYRVGPPPPEQPKDQA